MPSLVLLLRQTEDKNINMKSKENKLQKYFSEKTLVKLFKMYCYLHGITKGKIYIHYQSGFTNKDGGGIVCWAEIELFTAVKVTDTKVGYDIAIKLFNPDHDLIKQLGDDKIYIEKEYFNYGYYPFRKVKALLKAQPLLKQNFSTLIKPF
jgi:hypothetical protein